jgi:NADPH:quinone reductase-like Zn-dependent oxidoreductase
VKIGPGIDSVKEGQIVFGRLELPTQFGTLGQYIIAPKAGCVPLPSGIDLDQASTLGAAGSTAWTSIVPYVKSGSKIFINGGSGGVGTFGIQIAKAKGCHVTTSCSSANVALCKSLGADRVIDYKTANIIAELKKQPNFFDLVVDNVGTPSDLYFASTHFLKPDGMYMQVAAHSLFSAATSMLSKQLWPAFLGGGTGRLAMAGAKNDFEIYTQLAKLVQEGKIKAIIDSTFEYSDAPKAFERLQTGRAQGKIVVRVTEKP